MGDWIDGDIGDKAHQITVNKNLRQTSVQRDTTAWREFVRRDLVAMDDRLTALHHRVNTVIITLIVVIGLTLVMAGLTIRQFDMRTVDLDSMRIRLNRLESIERIRATFPNYAPGVPREEP